MITGDNFECAILNPKPQTQKALHPEPAGPFIGQKKPPGLSFCMLCIPEPSWVVIGRLGAALQFRVFWGVAVSGLLGCRV